MKKLNYLFLALFFIMITSCGDDDDEDNQEGVGSEYKQEMRNFVQGISSYSKAINSSFVIIPQNGHELVSVNGESDGQPELTYLGAIDALGQEDLLYGYDDDDVATPTEDSDYLMELLDKAKNNGKVILVTDYCWTQSKMDDSYAQNNGKGYISFAADDRELSNIPDYPARPYNVNSLDINTMDDVKNFLYIINPSEYSSRADVISTVAATNYDLLIIDLFDGVGEILSSSDITSLKTKGNGGTRMVVCYMSIGEAEDYRYYWQDDWNTNAPDWLDAENSEWEGNYKVKYWMDDWQAIIYGSSSSYLDMILDAGFDGVYLDIIEAFEYYE